MNLKEIMAKPEQERTLNDNKRIVEYNMRREMAFIPILPLPRASQIVRCGVTTTLYPVVIPEFTDFIRITGMVTTTGFPVVFHSFSNVNGGGALSTVDGTLTDDIMMSSERLIFCGNQKMIYVGVLAVGWVGLEFFSVGN
jgi:hypothetical protein